MFGAGSDHNHFRDINVTIVGEFLAILLFPDVHNQGYGWVDALIETVEVSVEVGLINVAVTIFYVVDEVLDLNIIEAFNGII